MRFRTNDVVRIKRKLYVVDKSYDDYDPWILQRINQSGEPFFENNNPLSCKCIQRLDDFLESHSAVKVGERKVLQSFEIKWEK